MKSLIWSARPQSMRALVVVVVLCSLALAAFGVFTVGDLEEATSTSDATADWLVASALADDLDPHADLRDLADNYGVQFWESETRESRILKHPRTPGALVLLLPMSLLPATLAYVASLILSTSLIAAGTIMLSKHYSLTWLASLLVLSYCFLSGSARWSILFGSQGPVLFFGVALFLVLLDQEDTPWTGVSLAVVGTLKVFPLILMAVLIARKQTRAMLAAVGTLAALNLLPLFLPNVSIDSTLTALTTTASNWFEAEGNIGLIASMERVLGVEPMPALAIGLTAVALASLLVLLRSPPNGTASSFLLCVCVLALPVAWPHYVLAIVPAVVVGLGENVDKRTLGYLVFIGAMLTIPFRPLILQTTGLALVALAFGVSVWRYQGRRGDRVSGLLVEVPG